MQESYTPKSTKWQQCLELCHLGTVIFLVGLQFFPLQNGNIGLEINKNFSKRHEGASVELVMNVLFLELGSGYTDVFDL